MILPCTYNNLLFSPTLKEETGSAPIAGGDDDDDVPGKMTAHRIDSCLLQKSEN